MQNAQATEQGTPVSGKPHTGSLLRNNSEERRQQLRESREDLDSRGGEGGLLHWGEPPLAVVHRGHFASCADLSTPQDLDKLRALLPSYRAAPDYETAIQHKYRRPSPQGVYGSHPEIAQQYPGVGLYGSQAEIAAQHYPGGIYGSHPEIAQQYPGVLGEYGSQAEMTQYPDVAQLYPLQTYSTPDLDRAAQGLRLLHLCKPPPPYPLPTRPSTSTPDLASTAHTLRTPRPTYIAQQVSGSSPDLVSSRSLGLSQHHLQLLHVDPDAHRTYTNLALLEESRPGVVYCMGGSRQRATTVPYHSTATAAAVPYQTAATAASVPYHAAATASPAVPMSYHKTATASAAAGTVPYHSSVTAATVPYHATATTMPYHTNATAAMPYHTTATEPIYENVPLPWASHRSRASSIQSAPDNPPLLHYPPASVSTPSSSSLSCSLPSEAGGEKKGRRKWGGLLGGGGGKGKSKSKTGGGEESGLPRGPTLASPSSVSKETMCQLLEKKLADSQLFFEFEKIPKKKTDADYQVAAHPDNAMFNRYSDVLPYEESRVRLTPSKENKAGYINASHITASVGSQQRFYIAAQGPVPAALNSWWQMVWEADVYLLVQLAGAGEDGGAAYCPVGAEGCLEAGEFQVWRQFSQETGHCVTTKLRLYHSPSRSVRGVWHLQYAAWGDQGCPHSPAHFLGFLEELGGVRQHATTEIPPGHNRNTPVLVHCTAGVGRTGVCILADLLLHAVDHNQDLDVPRILAQLRLQRGFMVQTVAQYRFVYTLIIYYLKHSRLI